MLKRYGLFFFALGLAIASPSFAQQLTEKPKDQQSEGDGQQAGQGNPAPPGFPVRILEDPEQTESAEREQSEAEQREIEDLKAQNLAAKSAQRAVWVSAAQTILAFFGTIALLYSLHLNRKATNAAVEAVSVTRTLGEAELRAYISFGGVRMVSHWEDDAPEKIFWMLHFSIKNTGATPARHVKVRTHFQVVGSATEISQIPPNTPPIDVPVGIGESVGVGSYHLTGPDFGAIKRGEKRFYFLCEVAYGNAINPSASHLSRMGTYSGAVTGDPEKYWDPANPVSVALPHMLGFNENS